MDVSVSGDKLATLARAHCLKRFDDPKRCPFCLSNINVADGVAVMQNRFSTWSVKDLPLRDLFELCGVDASRSPGHGL